MRRLPPRSARARRGVGLVFALLALASATSTVTVLHSPPRAAAASTAGYWLVGTDGGIFTFGQAGFYGSTGSIRLNQPVVGMAPTATGRGYWMVASDGGIFTFGDAGFYGSMGGKPLNKPIVAMASTKSGKGYWLVAADGGIFSFGDAVFLGSTGSMKLNRPIVDMAATPTGRGYWLAASDGGIFSFGDAGFHGSTGSIDLAKRIHGMTATPTGKGYWMVAGDGGIFAFGDAGFHGSASGGGGPEKRVIDMAPSASGRGYYITTSNGQVLAYGDAKYHGGTDEMRLNNRIVTMAAQNANEPPVAVEDLVNIEEDLSISIDVLANDRDPDGGVLTLRSVSNPLRGTAAVSGRSVSYKPGPDVNGSDFFTYTVSDDRGDSTTGRVNIVIKPVNDNPKAADDTATVLEDIPLSIPVLLNDTGLGDGLKAMTVSSAPNHGTATVNADRTITYNPAENFSGTDSFEYKVTDADDDNSRARVSLTVAPVNDIPLAGDDALSTRGGRSISDIDVKANDSSPDGFRYFKFADAAGNPTEDGRITTAGGGSVSREGSGRFSYAPARGFAGSDSFRYVIIDGAGPDDPEGGDVSNPATVTISVGINEAPIASDGKFAQTVAPGETVSGSIAHLASDPEGDDLTFVLKNAPIGQIELKTDGRFTYTAPPAPAPSFDQFTFVVDDRNRQSNEATVTIEITPPPPPPPPPPQAQLTPTLTPAWTWLLAPLGPLMATWRRRRKGKA